MYLRITLMVIIGIGINLYLLLSTELPNQVNNGFIRHFVSVSPDIIIDHDIPGLPQRILWSSSSEVVFTAKRSEKLIRMTFDSLGSSFIFQAELYQWLRQREKNSQPFPKFYHRDSELSALLISNETTKSVDLVPFHSRTVANAIALSPNSYILRQYEPEQKGLKFIKFTNGERAIEEHELSLSSDDHGLATDGHLLYDTTNGLLTFTHYYNNQVLVFDSLLNKVSRFSTLDTIKPKRILPTDQPKLVTNKTTALKTGKLYVCSNLRADNEPYHQYMKNIPVDVYEIPEGRYLGSFYLPVHKGKLIKNLQITDEYILALYFDDHFAVYLLPQLNHTASILQRLDIPSQNTSLASRAHAPILPNQGHY